MHVEVWFDGSCQPMNPGGRAGFGWIAYEHDGTNGQGRHRGQAIAQNHGFVGEGEAMSNNVAEYAAVLDAMRWILAKRPQSHVIFYGDSALVIHQMSGRWKIKRGLYTQVANEAKQLAVGQKRWAFRWVPREENTEADALSEMGSR